MANRSWSWETEDSEWGVEVDEAAGVLHWWGSPRYSPTTPMYAQGGGGLDQTIADLVTTRRPTYPECPPSILAEVIAEASRIWALRPKPAYYSLEKLVTLIDEPNRSACVRILSDHWDLFATVQGSTHNHQAWPGGYFDHVREAMNIAVVLYQQLSALRPLPFSLSDILLVVYLHDIEKPWKYELVDGQLQHKADMQGKAAHQAFRMAMLAKYGVTLTADHENGLKYAEGELADYTNQRRVMGPLAALAHMCDVASARLWFDHPAAAADPWPGAERVKP